MKLPQQPRSTKRLLMRALSLLGPIALTACASTQIQTVISPIPVDGALRADCDPPALPAPPVTPSALALFSQAQGVHGACERARAEGLLATIDAHNASAPNE